ncbi:MAG: hypothetical protein PVI66_15245 [Candidatus Aminicenantes bacterium]|jgi:hypothetical protein
MTQNIQPCFSEGKLKIDPGKVCKGLGIDLDKNVYATNLLKNFFYANLTIFVPKTETTADLPIMVPMEEWTWPW